MLNEGNDTIAHASLPGHMIGEATGDIVFASPWDAAEYQDLATQRRHLERQLVTIDGEMAAILRRATWSLDAVREWDG